MDSAVIVAIVTGVFGLAGTIIGIISTAKRKADKNEQAVKNGLQSLLRAEIIRSYEKYTDKGYCPIYAKEALKIEYGSYHALGGNDVATELYKKTLALNTEPPVNPRRRKTDYETE